jgi:hypothetical protein
MQKSDLRRERCAMKLLGIFLLSWIGLNALNYFTGLAVEAVFGPGVSLLVFIGLFFLSAWVAWLFAVWFTAPEDVALDRPAS